MLVDVKTLNQQLEKIDNHIKADCLEDAVHEAAILDHLLVKIFDENHIEQPELKELQLFHSELNSRVEILKKRQLDIQNQVAAITMVGSNKISRTYLTRK